MKLQGRAEVQQDVRRDRNLEAWQASGRDPNFGQDELDDAALEAITRDNEARFARQLEAVRKGDHGEVPRPWDAKATWARSIRPAPQ